MGVTTESLEAEFEKSAKIAQIFSGAFFAGVVLYLVFSNSTKLSFIQQASQEKRLVVCCYIGTMVAALSSFLSFFQITEVDNQLLAKNMNYTVDMARPIEWVLTCPMMQLTLVLMGGPRIPEHRRLLMPGFSATIVAFGTLSLFLEPPQTFFCYAAGLIVFGIMAYFNRLQILEHSNGSEGLLSGDSEFRKATLILLLTWLPFPLWYALSPEGFGVINDIVIIQMGWMFLNCIAKGASILYIQRSKDNYIARLKVSKLMKGVGGGPKQQSDDDEENAFANASLGPCVAETMTYLGMSDKAERFLKLLKDAKINSLERVQQLTQEQCMEKKLPYDLIAALQKRHRIWKLEVQDDAEEGIERGESHYAKQHPKQDGLESPEASQGNLFSMVPPPPPSMMDPMSAAPFGIVADKSNGATRRVTWLDQQIQQMQMDKAHKSMSDDGTPSTPPCPVSGEEILGKLASIEEHLKSLARLEEKMDSGFQGVCRVVEKRAHGCQDIVERGLQGICQTLEKSGTLMEKKVDLCLCEHDREQKAMREETQYLFAQVAEKFAEQTSEIRHSNEAALTTLSHAVEETLVVTRSSSKSDAQDSGKSVCESAEIGKLFAMWADKIITEARSNSFTLQTRMSAAEEAQGKNQAELEKRLMKKIEEASSSATDLCIKKVNCESQELHARSLACFNDQVNGTLEKHVQIGVGILTNTFRAHVDTLQAEQAKVEDDVKSHIDAVKMQILEQTEQFLYKFEASVKTDVSNVTMSSLLRPRSALVRGRRASDGCDLMGV